jgi:hypothetical protein
MNDQEAQPDERLQELLKLGEKWMPILEGRVRYQVEKTVKEMFKEGVPKPQIPNLVMNSTVNHMVTTFLASTHMLGYPKDQGIEALMFSVEQAVNQHKETKDQENGNQEEKH